MFTSGSLFVLARTIQAVCEFLFVNSVLIISFVFTSTYKNESRIHILFVNSVLIMPSVPISTYWHEGRIHSVFSLVLLQLYLLLLFLHSGRKVEFTVLFINSASIISFVCMST